MNDIYSTPEKFGLEIVWDADGGGGYDWNTVTVFGSAITGALWAGRDGGCSCNSPFDQYDSLDSINELERIDPNLGRDPIRATILTLLQPGIPSYWSEAEAEQMASAATDKVLTWADLPKPDPLPAPHPVEITCSPPSGLLAFSIDTVTALDALALTLPGHDWQINVHHGRDTTEPAILTARPTTTEKETP